MAVLTDKTAKSYIDIYLLFSNNLSWPKAHAYPLTFASSFLIVILNYYNYYGVFFIFFALLRVIFTNKSQLKGPRSIKMKKSDIKI